MATILAVDDEPHIRDLLTAVLVAEGHQVEVASGGEEALESVGRSIPDLIVLDLAMPGMDGWRFLEELYIRGIRKKTRVVIMSGHVEEYPPQDGSSPTRHFLAKPFDVASLITLVNDALERAPQEIYQDRNRASNLARLLEKMEDVIG